MSDTPSRFMTMNERIAVSEAVRKLEQSDLLQIADSRAYSLIMTGHIRVHIPTTAENSVTAKNFTIHAGLGPDIIKKDVSPIPVVLEGTFEENGTARILKIGKS